MVTLGRGARLLMIRKLFFFLPNSTIVQHRAKLEPISDRSECGGTGVLLVGVPLGSRRVKSVKMAGYTAS